MNARMPDGRAQSPKPMGGCDDCGMWTQLEVDATGWKSCGCTEVQAERLSIVPDAMGVLIVDSEGMRHGMASTIRGARLLRRRLLKRN